MENTQIPTPHPADAEPSSGIVDTKLAKELLAYIPEAGLNDAQIQNIKNIICGYVQRRRYPCIALAAHVANNLQDTLKLRRFLVNYKQMKKELNDKIRFHANQVAKIVSGDGVLLYGYSEAVSSVLHNLLDCSPDQVTIFVPFDDNRRRFGDAIKTVSKIGKFGFPISIIPHKSVGHYFTSANKDRPNKRDIPKISMMFVGCKSIILSQLGVNFNCTIGALTCVQCARSSGVPVYMVGESYKIWLINDNQSLDKHIEDILTDQYPEGLFAEAEQVGEEFRSNGINAQVENPRSDVVPADFISFLITEKGFASQDKLHPDFIRKEYLQSDPNGLPEDFWDPELRTKGINTVDEWLRDYNEKTNTNNPGESRDRKEKDLNNPRDSQKDLLDELIQKIDTLGKKFGEKITHLERAMVENKNDLEDRIDKIRIDIHELRDTIDNELANKHEIAEIENPRTEINPDQIGKIINSAELMNYDRSLFQVVLFPAKRLGEVRTYLKDESIPFLYVGPTGAILVPKTSQEELMQRFAGEKATVYRRFNNTTYP